MGKNLKIAELTAESLSKLRALEDKMGVHIMAFEPAVKLAELTEEQLNEVKALEKDLGVTLLVYTL